MARGINVWSNPSGAAAGGFEVIVDPPVNMVLPRRAHAVQRFIHRSRSMAWREAILRVILPLSCPSRSS